MFWFTIGMFVGAAIGMLVSGLCVAAKGVGK